MTIITEVVIWRVNPVALRPLYLAGIGLALLLALAVVAACGIAAWVGLAMSLLVFIGWRRACLKRLGGFTGDTLGALVELGEAAVLLALLFVIH